MKELIWAESGGIPSTNRSLATQKFREYLQGALDDTDLIIWRYMGGDTNAEALRRDYGYQGIWIFSGAVKRDMTYPARSEYLEGQNYFGYPYDESIIVSDAPLQGIPFYDDDGELVGQIIEQDVYLTFNPAFFHDYSIIQSVWENIFERLALILKEPERYVYELNNLEEIRQARALERYVEIQRERGAVALQQERNTLATIENTIANALRTLNTARNDRQDALRRYRVAMRPVNLDLDHVTNEFNALRNTRHVKSVEVRNKNLVIKTDTIYSKLLPDGTIREFGEFQITYPVGGNDNWPLIQNLTRKVNEREHPHIPSPREACWGNISTSVSEMMAHKDYAMLTQFLLRFLEQINELDPWGMMVYDWPVHSTTPGMTPFGSAAEGNENMCHDCGTTLADCECDRCENCNLRADDCTCENHDPDLGEHCGCEDCYEERLENERREMDAA